MVQKMNESSEHWKRMLLAAHRVLGVRLFRNNTGQAWVGRAKRLRPGQTYQAQGGEVVIQGARPLHAGLIKGAGDGIGWRTIQITPDMVGQKIAVFVSVEAKYGSGKLEPDQRTWDKNVRDAGGISIVARSPDQLTAELQQIKLLP